MIRPISLYVDLDGTLTLTDTLHEQIVGLMRSRPWILLLAPYWLMCGGKARLKHEVARRVTLEVQNLPYDRATLEQIFEYQAQGRKIVLATAANTEIAEAVAAHIGVFDEVISSTPEVNLSGRSKLNKIRESDSEFAYIGNGRADIPIWEHATEKFIVNGPATLERRIIAAGGTSLGKRDSILAGLVKAARPHQWLKNLLLFVPLLVAHKIGDPSAISSAGIGFLSFCLCASGVYVLNDLLDIENDRKHHKKRFRPFAAGTVPIPYGIAASLILTLAGIALAISVNWPFVLVLCGYLLITNAYSFRLKKVIMLDVVTLAGLYTARVIAGAEAIDVPLSFWLLSFSMFLFLSLALVKRYCEIAALEDSGVQEAGGRGYSVDDKGIITQLGTASGIVSVLVMALYVNSEAISALYSEPRFVWIVCPLLLYWIGRIWLLAHRGEVDEDPVVFAAKDMRTMLVGALVAVAFILASTQ